MKISLINTGKRFNRDWIFRNINYQFTSGKSYAITGPNGSGKSTLLQVIGGAIGQSEGNVDFGVETENVYQHIALAAPYLEVVEEMTATEFLTFHSKFKSFLPGIEIKQIIAKVGLEKTAHKQIRYFSSGMKQRIKLAQAVFSDVACLLLDEPCTNLDSEGIALYLHLINEYCSNRLVIVSSNDEQEYGFCTERIDMLQWK